MASLTEGYFGINRVRSNTVGTTPVKLQADLTNPSTGQPLGRGAILVQNKGTVSIFVGDSNVTTGSGIEIAVSSDKLFVGPVEIYAVASAAGQDVRVMELL